MNHRFRMRGIAMPGGKEMTFDCPCGFSVAQTPTADTFPHAFIGAVNQHLRMIAINDGNVAANHIALVKKT